MKDFAVVAVLQSEADLGEPVENLILRYVIEPRLRLILVLILDLGLKVAIVSVVHHNTQLSLLCLVDLSEPNDIRMIEYLQYLGLTQSLLPFFITHSLDVDLLNDCEFFVRLTLDQVCCSE